MAQKYRKIDPRVWDDEKFATLHPLEKLLVFNVITGQSNRCGIFKFSTTLAAEQVGLRPRKFQIAFCRVCETLGWRYDSGRRVLYIPTWWKYNTPENPKHLIGCLADLHDVPRNDLLRDFGDNTTHLPAAQHETFRIAMGKRSVTAIPTATATAMRYQEQEQEQEQERERERDVPAAVPRQLQTQAFQIAWDAWQKHRLQLKKKLTPLTVTSQLTKLARMGEARAIEAIQHSIENGWIGLFEPKINENRAAVHRRRDPAGREFAEHLSLFGTGKHGARATL